MAEARRRVDLNGTEETEVPGFNETKRGSTPAGAAACVYELEMAVTRGMWLQNSGSASTRASAVIEFEPGL